MKFGDFAKIKSLATPQGFRDNLQQLGLAMPCDDALEAAPSSPLAQPLSMPSGEGASMSTHASRAFTTLPQPGRPWRP